MTPAPFKFIRFGAMDVTKLYKLICFGGRYQTLQILYGLGPGMSPNPVNLYGLGAMDVTKPCKCIGFVAMDGTRPYKFRRFGVMDVTKPFKFICFGGCHQTL